MNYFYFKTIILLLLFNCCRNNEKPNINVVNIIKEAEILTFNDLNNRQREDLKYCCTYHINGTLWNAAAMIPFKKEDAYFVKSKIDNNLLADLIESEDFSKTELLQIDNFHGTRFLYGKYMCRWIFTDSLNEIIGETDKFDGHRILSINRSSNIDDIVVGPLVKKPKKMYIKIFESKNYPGLNPEFEIK
ncbi:MAG: hypothetical protein IPK88_09980 [Saprospiraceae bacterium]|nr:hypothetical protein [Candidatus Defluviibacterium haderslevense]